jgi:hypothetical protein
VLGESPEVLAAWDGQSWRRVDLPGPAYWPGHTLACAPGSCLVTGRDDGSVAARWDGDRFTAVTAPGVPVDALACGAPTFCVARSPQSPAGSLLRWNGTAWATVTLPGLNPAPAGVVGDIACGGPDSCLVLAQDSLSRVGARLTYVVPANGPAAPVNGAVPPATGLLACGAPGACVVVGNVYPNGQEDPMPVGARWDGTAWTATAPPDRLRASGRLSSVSCPADDWCLAAGAAGDGVRGGWALNLQVWDGGAWSVLPGPDNLEGYAPEVRCASPSACAIDGLTVAGTPRAVTARWNGHGWSVADRPVGAVLFDDGASALLLPYPADAGPAPADPDHQPWPEALVRTVSCPTADTCVALGSRQRHDQSWPTWRPVFFHWAGGAWTERAAPYPEGAGDVGYGDLTCPASDRCVAVGNADHIPGAQVTTDHPVIARWDGTAWSSQRSPSGSRGGYLGRVSCAGTRCLALGADYENGPHAVAAITDDASTGSWLLTVPPAFDPLAVSCRPATCTVVGSRTAGPGEVQAAARFTFGPAAG